MGFEELFLLDEPDNLVSLCLKIINSVIVVRLYYGFMTTFSTGPSYLFLLRAHVMEEGIEKKISTKTSFSRFRLLPFRSPLLRELLLLYFPLTTKMFQFVRLS